jgi:hypothetical protein
MPDAKTQEVLRDIRFVESVFRKLLKVLPSFDVTSEKILPYGMKPHTRSVSWLVEQVITQQTKYNAKALGLKDAHFDFPDTCLHDCELISGGKSYFVNVKVHSMAGKENKNDIAAVEKLYMQYSAEPSYNLIYACFGIHFQNIHIRFDPNYLHLFSPQFLPIYINPRNDKIQALYHHQPELRTRSEFLDLLRRNSKSIVLKRK